MQIEEKDKKIIKQHFIVVTEISKMRKHKGKKKKNQRKRSGYIYWLGFDWLVKRASYEPPPATTWIYQGTNY